MAQVTDRTVGANPTGFDMRTELNNIIAALESDNSGSSEPLNTVAGMKWLDTSDATYYYYKERNHDNTAWVTLFRYTVATKIMEAVSNGIVLKDTAIEIHASTSKTTPVDTDEIGLIDSASTFTLKKLTWANLKATLKNYFDTLYVALTGDQTINGTKTFVSFPITPSSEPTTNYQVANRKFVLDSVATITVPDATETVKGKVELATTAEVQSGTDTTKVVTPSGFRGASLGQGQTWQAVTRALSTSYTNSSGRAIVLVIYGSASTSAQRIQFTVGGVSFYGNNGAGSGATYQGASCVIPSGATYSFASIGGTLTSISCFELR